MITPSRATRSAFSAVLPRVVLVASAAIAIGIVFGRRNTNETMRGVTSQAGATPLASAVVLVTAEDCVGALDFLDLFARESVATQLGSQRILVTASNADTSAVRRRLNALGIDFEIGQVPRRVLRSLRRAGVSQTPAVLIYRPDGSLAIAAAAPASIDQYLALGDMLEAALIPKGARQ